MSDYLSADGYPVTKGAKFWDNDLKVVEITKVAGHAYPYADTGCVSTWHETTNGSSDTLDGHMQPYGRLARYFERKDAETLPVGTNYSDVK
jgi:hypothetical protein